MKLKLFISYARSDKYRVAEIVTLLRDSGNDPWFDRYLVPGQDWREELVHQVQNCDAFVYMLTPASLASEWCQLEFGAAIQLEKPVIPIMLFKESAEHKLPESISHIQYADFSEKSDPATVANLMGGLMQIAKKIPLDAAPATPVNPAGYPAQVDWPHEQRMPDYRTVSQQHLKPIHSTRDHEAELQSRETPSYDSHAGKIIGIDFGTTSSLCAVIHDGEPVTIPNRYGHDHTPSAVGLNMDGEIVVGEAAIKLALQHPERAVLQVKRLLGTDLSLEVDDDIYSPAQVTSYILETLKEDAEHFLGGHVDEAVITAPAYFDYAQIGDMLEAANLAGLDVLRIIAEPTAAALSADLAKKDSQAARWAIYDLGGGTFDVSILELGDNVYEVRSINGDTRLGGLDFDQIIVDYCIREFQQQTGIDLTGNHVAEMRIREAVEHTKIILSTTQQSSVDVPYIYADENSYHDLSIPLSRMRFEELTFHLIERTVECCQQALTDAYISKEEIDHIAFVGLVTKTPSVRETILGFFGKDKAANIDPDRAVALGAALQGGVLKGEIRDTLLLDVTPQTLAIETDGGEATPIIKRNTTIPTTKTVRFTTANDDMNYALIHIVQGEHPKAADNTTVATFVFDGIQSAPREKPEIEIEFDIDANGNLIVMVEDKQTRATRTELITGELRETLPPDVSATSLRAIMGPTSETLAIETMGGVATAVITKGTNLPTKKTLQFTVSQSSGNPDAVIHIVKGDRPMAADNISLARFAFRDISIVDKRAKLEITFEADTSGILTVTVTDYWLSSHWVTKTITGMNLASKGVFEELPPGMGSNELWVDPPYPYSLPGINMPY